MLATNDPMKNDIRLDRIKQNLIDKILGDLGSENPPVPKIQETHDSPKEPASKESLKQDDKVVQKRRPGRPKSSKNSKRSKLKNR